MSHPRRDPAGTLLGLVAFAAGIGLLVWTFYWAFQMFDTPPRDALNMTKAGVLDYSAAGQAILQLVGRIFMLLVMCLLGSSVASRGLRLYAAALPPAPPVVPVSSAVSEPEPESESESAKT